MKQYELHVGVTSGAKDSYTLHKGRGLCNGDV